MASKRIFYAAKRVGMGAPGTNPFAGGGSFQQLRGVQSVGMTTSFTLEQTFELGQIAVYEHIEGIPEISVEIERVLDGYCPAYILATSQSEKAANGTLVGRSEGECDFAMSIYPDTNEVAAGTRLSHVLCAGCMVDSVSYSADINGNATETVSLVGNNKVWYGTSPYSENDAGGSVFSDTDKITTGGSTEPKSLTTDVDGDGETGDGGVQTREDFLFGSTGSTLPKDIPGVNSSGKNIETDGDLEVHVQSFACSADLSRDNIFELGKKTIYHKHLPFPVEVSCAITVISTSGDLISATETGVQTDGNNTLDHPIQLIMREGLVVDLGAKNRLASVSVTGGDPGGGNEEVAYSYRNFNDFEVYHPQDPKSGSSGFAKPSVPS